MIEDTLAFWSMPTSTAHGSITLLTRLARETYRRSSVMGMGLKHFSVLNTLRDYEQLTQQALTGMLAVDANTVVHLLNDLEDQGLAERRRDPEDRRRHIVVITAKGQRALEKAEQKLETLEDEVLANLDATQRAQLHELLRLALDG
jgi:DNA-binding MarR family transcriptional regulator